MQTSTGCSAEFFNNFFFNIFLEATGVIRLYSSYVCRLLIEMLHKWNGSSCLPLLCVGSTHQWEVTRSSYSSVLSLFRSVRSHILIQPWTSRKCRGPCVSKRGGRSSAGRMKWHLRCSWQMHLHLLLTRCRPALLVFGQTLGGSACTRVAFPRVVCSLRRMSEGFIYLFIFYEHQTQCPLSNAAGSTLYIQSLSVTQM